MNTSASGLVLSNISKRFAGVSALKGVRLTAAPGEAMALLGANGAGKSTLMNILGGVIQRDEGTALLDGHPLDLASPRAAKAQGIAFVHQELTMLPTLTVAENIMIDHLPTIGGLIDAKALTSRAQDLLARLGCSFDAGTLVGDLGPGDQQMIEVARALSRKSRVVIFDEPTSSLTEPEKQRLFGVIRGLKSEGVIVIYITHFLDEVFATCDRVTVMRDGMLVSTGPVSAHTAASIAHEMLGEGSLAGDIPTTAPPADEVVLSVAGLTRARVLTDVSFELHSGEIVGLWGLLGSGRTELLRALVGLDPIDSGSMHLRRGDRLDNVTPSQLSQATAFVTEDRRGEGIFPGQSVEQNLSLPTLRHLLNRFGLVDKAREHSLADDLIGRLGIKTSGRTQDIATLSGGNQQKIVFGRWLGSRPTIFLLDEPTRGLDVGAKTEILRLAVEIASGGGGVLLIASEPEELMRVCHRYLLMDRGRIVGELGRGATRDDLVARVSNRAIDEVL